MSDARQQVRGAEQHVDVCPLELQLPLLRRHETVFHRVGQTDANRQADDPRGAFERVGRTHARLELIDQSRIVLERKKARRQDERLRLGFHAKQVEHGELAQILFDHPMLRFSV